MTIGDTGLRENRGTMEQENRRKNRATGSHQLAESGRSAADSDVRLGILKATSAASYREADHFCVTLPLSSDP